MNPILDPEGTLLFHGLKCCKKAKTSEVKDFNDPAF